MSILFHQTTAVAAPRFSLSIEPDERGLTAAKIQPKRAVIPAHKPVSVPTLWQKPDGEIFPKRKVDEYLQMQHVPLVHHSETAPWHSLGEIDGFPVLVRFKVDTPFTLEVIHNSRIKEAKLRQDTQVKMLNLCFDHVYDQEVKNLVINYLLREATLNGMRLRVLHQSQEGLKNCDGVVVDADDEAVVLTSRFPVYTYHGDFSDADWTEILLRQEASPAFLQRAVKSHFRFITHDAPLHTYLTRNYQIFLRLLFVCARAQFTPKSIAVFGLGLGNNSHTSEIYELAKLFPHATLQGFDYTRDIVDKVNDTGNIRLRVPAKALNYMLQMDLLFLGYKTYLYNLGITDQDDAVMKINNDITGRVSARHTDVLTDTFGAETFDVIVTINMLRYLATQSEQGKSTFWIKAVMMRMFSRLNKGGMLVMNTSQIFDFPFDDSELALLGMSVESLHYKSSDVDGDHTFIGRAYILRRVSDSPLLTQLCEQIEKYGLR